MRTLSHPPPAHSWRRSVIHFPPEHSSQLQAARSTCSKLLEPPDPNGPYVPYAFGLSGLSEQLTSFNGGNGRLGLHGTNDPDSIGQDVSHGCIRVANDVVIQLAELLPLGTPVQISP